MPKSISFFLLLLLLSLSASAQYALSERSEVYFGLTMELGTHANRIGMQGGIHYRPSETLQLIGGWRAFFGTNGYGPQKQRNEVQLRAGFLAGFGEKQDGETPFRPTLLSNHTGRINSFSYIYNFYIDDVKTSQRTAIIALQFDKFGIAMENDAFADAILDRFRTGAFLLAWEDGDTRYALSSLLWTGDPSSKGRRNIDGTNYPGRYGCVDLGDALYGRESHGLLSLQVRHRLRLDPQLDWDDQFVTLDLGLDAEQIRHALQNRLIHDAFFIPQGLLDIHNRHVPMLDKDGNPYLFKEGQQIRKPRIYLRAGLNVPVFY